MYYLNSVLQKSIVMIMFVNDMPNFLSPFCNLISLNQIISDLRKLELWIPFFASSDYDTNTFANVRTLMTGLSWLPFMVANLAYYHCTSSKFVQLHNYMLLLSVTKRSWEEMEGRGYEIKPSNLYESWCAEPAICWLDAKWLLLCNQLSDEVNH